MFFFFNDTATTEIYTLSLHDALPISGAGRRCPRAGEGGPRGGRRRRHDEGGEPAAAGGAVRAARRPGPRGRADRERTRLNSTHAKISYAIFCLKKKKYNVSYKPAFPL